MKFLSIDSSTPQLSVALLDQNQPLSQQQLTHHPPEPNPVLRMVDTILNEAGMTLPELDGFVLTTGPGSFTGLRVGLSLVKGFVLATEKPVVGINTLEAWAACTESHGAPVCSLLDARKGELYFALYQMQEGILTTLEEARVAPAEALSEVITERTCFIGTGLERYGTALSQMLGDLYSEGIFKEGLNPAAAAGQLAAKRFSKEGNFDVNQLQLEYIRRPEAEKNLQQMNSIQ